MQMLNTDPLICRRCYLFEMSKFRSGLFLLNVEDGCGSDEGDWCEDGKEVEEDEEKASNEEIEDVGKVFFCVGISIV